MNTPIRAFLVSIIGMLLASCMQDEESVQAQEAEESVPTAHCGSFACLGILA